MSPSVSEDIFIDAVFRDVNIQLLKSLSTRLKWNKSRYLIGAWFLEQGVLQSGVGHEEIALHHTSRHMKFFDSYSN